MIAGPGTKEAGIVEGTHIVIDQARAAHRADARYLFGVKDAAKAGDAVPFHQIFIQHIGLAEAELGPCGGIIINANDDRALVMMASGKRQAGQWVEAVDGAEVARRRQVGRGS